MSCACWEGSIFCNWPNSLMLEKLNTPATWNESGFRPPLCTYRLNWARKTSWGWWDDWDDTVLQTQDSKFEPWRSEAEHATSRSRRLPAILTFTRGWGRNFFQTAETGNRAPNSGVKGSGANHYPRAPPPPPPHSRVISKKKNLHIVGIQIWKADAWGGYLNCKNYTILIQIFKEITLYVVSLKILWRCSRRARSCWQSYYCKFLNDVSWNR